MKFNLHTCCRVVSVDALSICSSLGYYWPGLQSLGSQMDSATSALGPLEFPAQDRRSHTLVFFHSHGQAYRLAIISQARNSSHRPSTSLYSFLPSKLTHSRKKAVLFTAIFCFETAIICKLFIFAGILLWPFLNL